jgi:hypothetical protein
MGAPFEPTPELCEAIKEMAYNGLSMEDIANKLGRPRETIFYNSQEKYPEVNLAYLNGKRAHKERLLKELDELGQDAESEEVKFKTKRYQLAVLHKVVETTKQEITGADGNSPFVVNIVTGGNANQPANPSA